MGWKLINYIIKVFINSLVIIPIIVFIYPKISFAQGGLNTLQNFFSQVGNTVNNTQRIINSFGSQNNNNQNQNNSQLPTNNNVVMPPQAMPPQSSQPYQQPSPTGSLINIQPYQNQPRQTYNFQGSFSFSTSQDGENNTITGSGNTISISGSGSYADKGTITLNDNGIFSGTLSFADNNAVYTITGYGNTLTIKTLNLASVPGEVPCWFNNGSICSSSGGSITLSDGNFTGSLFFSYNGNNHWISGDGNGLGVSGAGGTSSTRAIILAYNSATSSTPNGWNWNATLIPSLNNQFSLYISYSQNKTNCSQTTTNQNYASSFGESSLGIGLWNIGNQQYYSSSEGSGCVIMNYQPFFNLALLQTSVSLNKLNNSSPNQDQVVGYPNISYGYDTSDGTPIANNFPVNLTNIPNFYGIVKYEITFPQSKQQNPVDFAYDIWFSNSSNPKWYNKGSFVIPTYDLELMIWLYYNSIDGKSMSPIDKLWCTNLKNLDFLPNNYEACLNCTNGKNLSYQGHPTIYLVPTPTVSSGTSKMDIGKVIRDVANYYNNKRICNQQENVNYLDEIDLGSEFEPDNNGNANYQWRISKYEFSSKYKSISEKGTTSAYPKNVSAVVNENTTSISLSQGYRLYIYGYGTGGGFQSSAFMNGQYASAINSAGNMVAALAVTKSNLNNFSTQTGYQVAGGVAITGFRHFTPYYGSDTSPGASSASVSFNVGHNNSLIVIVAIAGGGQSLSITGLPDLKIDAAWPGSPNLAMVIAHAYLAEGSYSVSEITSQSAAGQNPNDAGDIIGAFVFY